MFEHDDQLFFLFCDPFCWLLVRVRGCLFSMDEHNVRGFALTWRDMFKTADEFPICGFFHSVGAMPCLFSSFTAGKGS
jgi:hypothetical protein